MTMGVDYVVIGFDMEVQPLVTTVQLDLYAVCRERYLRKCCEPSSAIRTYATSAIGINVVSSYKLSHAGCKGCLHRYHEQS